MSHLTNCNFTMLMFHLIKKKEKLEGLGEIPKSINCVNDLLLYNSGKNLYKNFVIADALKGPQNIKEDDERDISDIGPAPHSISERSTLPKSTTQTYFYTPQIGEVPALDVPLDLPDLPGIADDLHYEFEVGPGIAPSVVATQNVIENIEELPAIIHNETEVKENDIPDVNLPPPPPLDDEVVKPPPIQEIPKPQPEPVSERSEVDLPKSSKVKEKLPKINILPPNDARSSLMDAIRKAGGSGKANLRSVSETEKEISTKPPSGDLMADLHLKLSMRRKGISGTKKQENSVDPDSTLGKNISYDSTP
ncbi:hypothetical protein NQ314_016293 [Rhamnusium bicolor]|uniref:WH2 domain-containing protein n=1 Tax=Rhamnusium bicolor TaxID=1586634 RepID=A0AAV8WWS7_9CUCU|nr:hypothetical protein NQ314_016293 [Rhamnusium bicolor]